MPLLVSALINNSVMICCNFSFSSSRGFYKHVSLKIYNVGSRNTYLISKTDLA